MASVKDVERVADDLESLVNDLRSEVKNDTDFARLMQIADAISEHADNAAQTFSSVNEALMSRLNDLGGTKKSSGGAQSKSQSNSSS
jgi:ABC-type transporter Mla subunit MlaD